MQGYIFVEMKLNSCIPIYFLVVIGVFLIFRVIANGSRNADDTRRYITGPYAQSAIRIAITYIKGHGVTVNVPTPPSACFRKPIGGILYIIRIVSS